MELTQELVKSLFDYHEDGYLIWRVKSCKKVNIGDRAGYLNKPANRYSIRINGKPYRVSRLVFFYHTGELPKNIDHINHITTDDRIQNLRAASNYENSRNTSSHKDSISKYLGVTWHKKDKRWNAYIMVNGKNKYLGSLMSEIQAALAYNKAAVKYYGEFANLNIIRPSVLQNNS